MVLNSVDVLIDALRETHLLRVEQFDQLLNDISPKFEDTQELADHIVKLGWVTNYQVKKLLAGRGQDLVLGHYIITEKLGEGGMGKVYKAKQLRLNRMVALKVIRPDYLANALALKRFQREAKAAAKLAHPNIVRLFDADQIGDRHFLAMEYVEGADLAAMVKQNGPLSVGMACSFIRQAATGLQHAHEVGMVHRDIKPSNLFVTSSGRVGKQESGGVVKILDMGLARLGCLEGDESISALTQDGTVIGTPDYMSPEQGKDSSTVGARSDLYSLGCTLFYLLIGKPPFAQGSTLEKLLQHQIDAPPKVQLLRSDVPKELGAVVQRLLAKKPEDRFESAESALQGAAPWSVFDSGDQRLPKSGKISRPDLKPVALELQHTPIPAAPGMPVPDVFDFEKAEVIADPILAPAAKPEEVDLPVKKNTRKRVMIGVACLLVLLVAGIVTARSLISRPAADAKENVSQEDEAKVGPRKFRLDDINYFLPPDTEMVAVLNMQQLGASTFFKESILPLYRPFVERFRTHAGFDPFKAVETVIVAVPSGSPEQSIVLLYGSNIANPGFMRWAAEMDGVKVITERIPGIKQEKKVYVLRNAKKDAAGKIEETYGAVLSAVPGVIVLCPNKDRVLKALARAEEDSETKFNDPSMRPLLAKYPPKTPSSLWIGAGPQSSILFDKAALKMATLHAKGVMNIIASLRLRDTMTVEIDIEAKSQALAIDAWNALIASLHLAATTANGDQRFEHLATLLESATPSPLKGAAKLEKPNTHQWWTSVSSDKILDWLAPFLGFKSNR